jgi:predicted MFS family arabinose efflux permease
VQAVAAAWAMVTIGGSATMVALVQTCTNAPFLLLGLVAGAAADLVDRRLMMLAAQALMFVLALILGGLALYGHLTPLVLLALTAAIGCGAALNGPAWQASVGDMVPRHLVPQAVAMNSMGFNIARSVGPAIGGAMITAAGVVSAFLLNAASYVGLIVALSRWQPSVQARETAPAGLWKAMIAGLSYASTTTHLRLLLRACAVGASTSCVLALMPVIARTTLMGDAKTLGTLFCAFGIGAVGAGVSNSFFRARLSNEGIVRLAAAMLALGSAVIALSSHLWISAIAYIAGGWGWILALTTFNVATQLTIRRTMIARCAGLLQMAAFGGTAAGSLLFGYVAQRSDARAAYLLSAALQIVIPLAFRMHPISDGSPHPAPTISAASGVE